MARRTFDRFRRAILASGTAFSASSGAWCGEMTGRYAVRDGIEGRVQALLTRRGDIGEIASGESTSYRLDGNCPVCGNEQGGQRAVAGNLAATWSPAASSASV